MTTEMLLKTVSELLRHIDLLGKTIQFLQDIAGPTPHQRDLKTLTELRNIYEEIEKQFIGIYNQEITRVTCNLPVTREHTYRQGRPAFLFQKRV